MTINGPPYHQYKLLRRPAGRQESFSLGSFLVFFSTKVLRGGPRLLAHLTTCFVVLVVLMKVVPHRLTDVNHSMWSWQHADDAEQLRTSVIEEDDRSVPGGLRIVVFGESDVATPARLARDMGSRSWTELMCEELDCSSHFSFVPAVDDPSRVMSSAELYAASIERTLNVTFENSGPGFDYNFMLDRYPIDWKMSDLSKQVSEFLSMRKPRHAPAETVWVFSFGTWDIWSLASEPLDVGKSMIDVMVSHVFEEVERLYASAMNETSIAWSDSSLLYKESSRIMRQTALGVAVPRETITRSPEGGVVDHEVTDDENTEAVTVVDRTPHFRILIPKLFDPSLTPGWHSSRPLAPSVHSKAEQMRNAAALTELWNEKMWNFMALWVRTPEPEETTRAVEEERSDHAGHPATQEATGKADTVLEKLAAVSAETSRKHRITVRGRQSHLSQPRVAGRSRTINSQPPEREGTTTEQPEPGNVLRSQRPQRDGIVYDLSNYLQEMIVDRQLRNSGLHDSRGLGTKPTQDGFLEVWKPCVQENADEPVVEEIPASEEQVEDSDGKADDANNVEDLAAVEDSLRRRKRSEPTRPTPPGQAPPSPAEAHPAQVRTGLRLCEAPHEHLFFTGFTVSPRAVAEIARQAADMVRQNETMRARWKSGGHRFRIG